MTDVRNVVLVHGGFVDGSGWQGVYDLLKADGFNVSVVQNQTLSLESDVETTHNVLDPQDGPAILVGHSYGGVVITEAGTARARRRPRLHRRVRARRRRVGQHADRRPAARRAGAADPAAPGRVPVPGPREVRGRRSRPTSRPSWRRSWPTRRSRGASRRSNGAVSEPAWRSKPSWYLVATDDRMIPPPAQRAMSERAGSTVIEAPGSHSIYVSQPRATADLIERAAREVLVESAAARPVVPALAGRQDAPAPAGHEARRSTRARLGSRTKESKDSNARQTRHDPRWMRQEPSLVTTQRGEPRRVEVRQVRASANAVLAVVAVAQFMVVLDGTVVNVALPSIQRDVGFSEQSLSWVLNAYTLLFGGFLLLGGRAADRLGRRRLFMAGIALFAGASLACGLSQSEATLLIARGARAGGALVSARGALDHPHDLRGEGSERNRALAVWGAIAGAGRRGRPPARRRDRPAARLAGAGSSS